MKKLIFPFVLIFAIFSCSQKEEKIIVKNVGFKKENRPSTDANVKSNKLLTINIEGMSCEMNCGGSIRKALKKTGAVSRVEFDWKEEAEQQTTKISFDDSKIDDTKIVKVIEEINEGQFTTSNKKVEDINEILNK